MDKVRTFLRNKKSVRFATFLSLSLLSLHFFLISFFETNFVTDVIALGNAQLNRLVSLIISLFLVIVTFGAYSQDKEIVNNRLKEIKDKITEEARVIKDDLEKSKVESEK